MNTRLGTVAAGIELAERGYLPDAAIRLAIRRLCSERLAHPLNGNAAKFWDSLGSGPIAPLPDAANAQHYELPPEFFELVLGPRRKYSCCLWRDKNGTLDDAEEAALEETSLHAELEDGMDILELGCGWGSLSLWMAERFPSSRITALSNSRSQRATIESIAASRQLTNLQVVTADMNDFARSGDRFGGGKFDRVVSVEMFEHMRNYELLLNRIASWLRTEGKLFVHLFCHRELAYPFATEGAADWMGRNFFTGGMMPSADLLRRFDRDLRVIREWQWNGMHYARTARSWLDRLDSQREALLPILRRTYGGSNSARWLQRWRMFFLAVEELFAFGNGQEWYVGHYLLEPTTNMPRSAGAP
jgi:cyclopropane-fatty-acyl-phospholipid synthase